MTSATKLQRFAWVFLLLPSWGCAAGSLPRFVDGAVTVTDNDRDMGVLGSDVLIQTDGIEGESDSGGGDSGAGGGSAPPCQPSCAGKTCGAHDGCGGTCQPGSGCCTPTCSGKPCGAGDGCGGTCSSGSGCTPTCTPTCAGKSCGASDGCGGTCSIGSGCKTSCGSWQAVSPDDPWDDSDPNYDGERGCSGSLIKDFGRVSLHATCRAKCEGVAATCCYRDHRGDHKSCKAYKGKVIAVGSCTGCTAATCK
jgi:hypothetical protein